jgi:NAD+ synthase (glutamine-hydrolysing)
MKNPCGFFNLYCHNFVRVALAVPTVLVADPAFNANQTIQLLRQAAEQNALLAVFPELGLSAYSCEDLFHQQALLDASRDALHQVVEASRDISTIAVVGLPLAVDNMLFNCAAVHIDSVMHGGNFDGDVGSMGGIEVIRAMNDGDHLNSDQFSDLKM